MLTYLLISSSYQRGWGDFELPVFPILGAALGLVTLFGLAHAFWAPVMP